MSTAPKYPEIFCHDLLNEGGRQISSGSSYHSKELLSAGVILRDAVIDWFIYSPVSGSRVTIYG